MSGDEPWSTLRRFTDARIGLGRSGAALPTREVLKFSMAHAQARDAVKTPITWEPIEDALAERGLKSIRVESAAGDRDTYLRRPDLGRQLDPAARQRLSELSGAAPDLLIVVGDGLSSTGVMANAVATIDALLPLAAKHDWTIGPVLLASQARVALGDDAGEFAGAKSVLMLIGERPGLSSPDSLGAYLTWQPRVGRKDAERNCISNIRAGGLSYNEAAFKIAWLLHEAFRRGLTGVQLKDESEHSAAIEAAPVIAIAQPKNNKH
jgi:ethanolamine ammonia-lyase small subunit